MASTSAVVANASSSINVTKKYDVFISFRGDDTRYNFTSHLHAALCRNNIETYIDYRIDKGDEVWVELLKAIKESSVFLVILSENYASSTWCLNELVEIIECKKNGEAYVIPVFYRIDPSQVRKQTGCYKRAFGKHKQNGEKMHKWKNVLYEVANFSGFDSRLYRAESDLIEDVVAAILQKLNQKYTNELKGRFILDENYSHIESLLKIDSREVRIIGIWGMGGIGKTTLAAAIFHKVSSQYEGSCFLENVAEESKRHGLSYIYNRLLSKLLRKDLHIDTPKVISSIVMRQLMCKKVFVVLDDVNTSEPLVNLIGVERDWLGPGSRVILTARDKHVLITGGVDEIHEVKEMNFQNSLKLFSLNAFNKTYPEKEYEELSEKAIGYAKGIPLVLKVLGSYLRFKSENEWDSALTKLKKIPNAEIQKVLRLSYDGLDDEEKNILLDIACFFKGQERDRVRTILNACGFSADIGIRNLLDKALITNTYNCITMHDLIQEMGREIVREESIKSPGQRSRLWNPEEIYNVLTNDSGTTAVEGIQLDMSQIKDVNLSSKAFKKMSNLRLLAFEALNGDFDRINSVYLPKGLQLLPKNLRYFRWDGYPLKFLSSTFCPEKLVELSMPYSNVENLWNGVQNLPNLEMIDLSESRLIECPNLSGASNLKYVKLSDCKSLSHVDPSIFSLPKLESLDVGGCTSLKSLCSDTCSTSLRGLYASRCYNLQEFSVTLLPSGSSKKHLYLCLGGWDLNELPSSLLHIRNRGNFTLHISDGFMDLPGNLSCQVTFTDSCKHESETLITLHKVLHSSTFQYVRHLIFMNCHNLCELPNSISLLSSLECLRLVGGDVTSLPENIRHLTQLKYLEALGCKKLQSIPAIPQSIECFHVWSCESLKLMLSSTSEPSKKPKCTFMFPNCMNLDHHSYDAILKYTIVSIDLGAHEEDKSSDHDDDDVLTVKEVKSGKFSYFFPSRSSKVREWFHYPSTQALVRVEVPPIVLGFVFYLVLSQDQSCYFGNHGSFGCECLLETSWGEMINITSFFVDEITLLHPDHLFEMMSDHVFLWYDAQCCKHILEACRERKEINDPKLTLKFFAQTPDDGEIVIKECGLRWIYLYPSEDQIVEEGGGRKCNRSREIHESEANTIRNIEGSESDQHEETVPPTKKSKHVIGTPSK